MGAACSTKPTYGIISATKKSVSQSENDPSQQLKSCLVNQSQARNSSRDRSLKSGPLGTQQSTKRNKVSVSTQTSLPYSIGTLIDLKASLYSLGQMNSTVRCGGGLNTQRQKFQNLQEKNSQISEASGKKKGKSRNGILRKISKFSDENSKKRLPILVDRRSLKKLKLESKQKKKLVGSMGNHRNISMCSIQNQHETLPQVSRKSSKLDLEVKNYKNYQYRRNCNKKNQLTMQVISPEVYYSTTKMGVESPTSPMK